VPSGERFVALAPGASCAARRYPADRFAEVASLVTSAGLPVVLLGSAKEEGLAQAILAATAGRPVVSLVGRTTIAELAAVTARATLVVTNDSGPMHLADAVGRPVVVLFSGTDLESQWRPRDVPARVLRRPTPCSPCYRFDCPYELECLDIPPSEVAGHIRSLLEETGGGIERAAVRAAVAAPGR
jgi:ADP-heptose:LPS heptosyltransferase